MKIIITIEIDGTQQPEVKVTTEPVINVEKPIEKTKGYVKKGKHVFPDKVCQDCGVSFTPKSYYQLRCQPCRDRKKQPIPVRKIKNIVNQPGEMNL